MAQELREELTMSCKGIAEELESYEYGQLVYIENEGGFVDKTEENEEEDDGLYGWLNNVMDIRVTTSLDGKDLYGARICVACGGPNIYVNTEDCIVEGYWGTEHVSVGISGSVCETLNDILDECRRE